MQTKAIALAGALIASLGVVSTANAASIIGLIDGKSLVWIDPSTKKVTGKADIKGAASVVGIDVRPADGMLYAVTADGGIYTVDAKTGQATMKSKLSETLKSGVTVTVDFNPVADRLRVITSDGTSLRVNVDDGKVTVDGSLKFRDGDATPARRRWWSRGPTRIRPIRNQARPRSTISMRRPARWCRRRRRTTAC